MVYVMNTFPQFASYLLLVMFLLRERFKNFYMVKCVTL